MPRNVLDVCCCCLKYLVLVISTKSGLELDQLGLSVLDMGADLDCILLQEVLVIPSLLMISKCLPDGPEPVPDVELLLKLCNLWNVCDRHLEGLLV